MTPVATLTRETAHDLRYCLHLIGMGLQTLKLVHNDAEEFGEVFAMLEKKRDKAAALVNEFLDNSGE